ncbi:hypothetical protein T492DRAFT_902781, partial [Pavlovales sp. CCMP2436]
MEVVDETPVQGGAPLVARSWRVAARLRAADKLAIATAHARPAGQMPHRALLKLDRSQALDASGPAPDTYLHLPRRAPLHHGIQPTRAKLTADSYGRPQTAGAVATNQETAGLHRRAEASAADPLEAALAPHWTQFIQHTRRHLSRPASAGTGARGSSPYSSRAATAKGRLGFGPGEGPLLFNGSQRPAFALPAGVAILSARAGRTQERLVAVTAEGVAALDKMHTRLLPAGATAPRNSSPSAQSALAQRGVGGAFVTSGARRPTYSAAAGAAALLKSLSKSRTSLGTWCT